MKLTHLGGQNTVTGSCHLLQHNGVNILVEGLMSEVRCPMSEGEDRCQMSDVRGRRSEDGRQMTDDRRLTTEDD